MPSNDQPDRTLPEGTIFHAAPLAALTPALTADQLNHIRENYKKFGESALERHCGSLLAHIDALTAERNDAVSLLAERDEEMDKVRNRAADAEFLLREMAAALERVLLDIDFMIEARRALSRLNVTP